ncbi:hypothetical protein NC652_031202 [Populus alba x Populus x berolinensis]|nr:hypothetical protein NC652_031202 [Populus alba x Populus x berolinensis]
MAQNNLRTCNGYFVHLVVYTYHVHNNLRAFPTSQVFWKSSLNFIVFIYN